MTPALLEKIVLTQQCDRLLQYRLYESSLYQDHFKVIHLYWLCLNGLQITSIPDNIGNFTYFIKLDISCNKLSSLPESISNLTSLTKLDLSYNRFTNFPESICNVNNLLELDLSHNQLTYLPTNLRNLINLKSLSLSHNKISSLERQPDLESAQLDTLPKQLDLGIDPLIKISSGLVNLTNLEHLDLNDNPLIDLSFLQWLPALQTVEFFDIYLPRRYWTKFSDWKPEWLLDEDNIEIRRRLIEQLGYEKICEELNTIKLDTWREYSLLKIDGVENIYNEDGDDEDDEYINTEPMVLLKMTCPSTAHIHILRVPPEIVSAEAAIVWVNHGIHPDEFAIQT